MFKFGCIALIILGCSGGGGEFSSSGIVNGGFVPPIADAGSSDAGGLLPSTVIKPPPPAVAGSTTSEPAPTALPDAGPVSSSQGGSGGTAGAPAVEPEAAEPEAGVSESGGAGGNAGSAGSAGSAGGLPVNCPPGYHLDDDSCVPNCTPLSYANACAGSTCGDVDDGCGGTITCGYCAPTSSNSSAGNVCRNDSCQLLPLEPNPFRAGQYDDECVQNDSAFGEAWLYGGSNVTSCITSGVLSSVNPHLVCCEPSTPCQRVDGVAYNCTSSPLGCRVIVVGGRKTNNYDCREGTR